MAKVNENPMYMLIKEFLTDYLPEKRKCSIHTIKAYRTALNQLLDYIQKENGLSFLDIGLDTLDRIMISSYLDYLETECHCSIRTRNHRLNCLRAFFSFVAQKNSLYAACYLEICKVPFKKDEKTDIIDYLSESALKTLLEQPDTTKLKGIRNQFLMILLYDTGARIQEVIGLRLCDIRINQTPQARLCGKGNKTRTVPLMAQTVQHYTRYLQIFHKDESLKSDRPLFYTVRKGLCNPISDDMIRIFMNEYAREAHKVNPEVPEKIHPHLFRHSRAMHLYQHGMDLTLISQWLGHADISTTLMYAHADTEMKRKAIEKATAPFFTETSLNRVTYDVNDDEVLKRLYGLKQ